MGFEVWQMEKCFLSLPGFTRRTLQNTHNAAGWGVGAGALAWDTLLCRSPAYKVQNISADTRVCAASYSSSTTASDAALGDAISQLTWRLLKLSWAEQYESAAWMTRSKNSVPPYIAETTAFHHVVLHLLSVILSHVGRIHPNVCWCR